MDLKKIISKKEIIFVEGSINGELTQGFIIRENSKYYFLQNEFNGSRPIDFNNIILKYNIPYKNSWFFKINSNGSFSDNVKIHAILDYEDNFNKIVKTRTIKNKPNGNSNSTNVAVYERVGFTHKEGYNIEYFEKENEVIRLFTRREHPDCCGSTILNGFDNSDKISYSRYAKLIEKDYKDLSNILNKNRAAFIAHITNKQVASIQFVEILGFKKMYLYKNNNSGNTINIYHYNPGTEKLNVEKLNKLFKKEDNLKTQNSKKKNIKIKKESVIPKKHRVIQKVK